MEDFLNRFILISKHRMVSHYLLKFEVCLKEVDEPYLWLEEYEGSNSVGGIILHIIEHISRNEKRYENPEIVFEQGIENYFPMTGFSKSELMEVTRNTFNQWAAALMISKKETIEIYSLYHLVEHTGYHLGQVVDRVQRRTGKRLHFVQNNINEKSLKEVIDKDK